MPIDRRDGQSAAVLLVLAVLGFRALFIILEEPAALVAMLYTVLPALVLVWLGLRWHRIRQARAATRWEQMAVKVVHVEKVEQLGHTQGGLSTPEYAEGGQLSEVEGGQLSEPEPEPEPER